MACLHPPRLTSHEIRADQRKHNHRRSILATHGAGTSLKQSEHALREARHDAQGAGGAAGLIPDQAHRISRSNTRRTCTPADSHTQHRIAASLSRTTANRELRHVQRQKSAHVNTGDAPINAKSWATLRRVGPCTAAQAHSQSPHEHSQPSYHHIVGKTRTQ